MKKEGERYTICVDFDGVIHSYTTPWIDADTIPDPPVPGALEWLDQMLDKFEVYIHTTRAKEFQGRIEIYKWLRLHGFQRCVEIHTTCEKVPALIYIDDRGYRFTGANFPTAQEIHEARPWNKQKQTEDKDGKEIY